MEIKLSEIGGILYKGIKTEIINNEWHRCLCRGIYEMVNIDDIKINK